MNAIKKRYWSGRNVISNQWYKQILNEIRTWVVLQFCHRVRNYSNGFTKCFLLARTDLPPLMLPACTVCDNLYSRPSTSLFPHLYHVSARGISAPVQTHTDWERFRSLTSDVISLRIQNDTAEEAEKAACNLTASVARHTACRHVNSHLRK
jgi:hypothetical protein